MTAPYRERLNRELPNYRAVHSLRIAIATRELVTRHPLEYDELLHDERGRSAKRHQWARAELRRRHRSEWLNILKGIPGTVADVRLGLTVEALREGWAK